MRASVKFTSCADPITAWRLPVGPSFCRLPVSLPLPWPLGARCSSRIVRGFVHTLRRATARAVVAGTVLAFAAACGGDPAAPEVPPVVTVTANGSTSIASGSAVQLVATFRDNRGRVVNNPSITWSSSDPSVASVASTGLVIGARAGTATVNATIGGISGGTAITVTPGSPVKLVLVTQPAGAVQRVPLVTQPVVEVRDASDNVVTSSTASVGVSTTVGVVTGSITVTAQQGVARFTDLALQGTAGPRTLQFNSGSLLVATSNPVELAPGAPTTITFVGSPPRVRSGIAAGSAITAQLRDEDGNAVPLAGRRVSATLGAGFGTVTVTGATTTTNAQGRAVFSELTLSGTAGTRTLSIFADSIAAPLPVPLTIIGGTPTRLVIDRDVAPAIEEGVPMSPPPVLRVVDAFGNLTEQAGVSVSATSAGATLANATAQTDGLGRATFAGFTFASGAGTRTVQFTAAGLTGVTSRAVAVAVAGDGPQPVTIVTTRAADDTVGRTIELATMTSSFVPFLAARDAQGQPMSTSGVRWFSRDPTRASVGADGRITGVAAGRTFVVAQASRTVGVADSVLVFIPRSGTGPIVRATLPSYRVRTDTFSITIEIVPRDGGTLSAADLEIAWPGNRAGVFSPFNVTQFALLRPDVVSQQVDAAQSLRVTWASATPVSGPVQLIRLRAQVNQRGQWNQVLITLNQLLKGDLTDVTAQTSIFNPIVVIP